MDVKLTIACGSSKGKTLQLRSTETLVGRGSGCDVRIPSSAVSRRHCRLSFRDGYLLVEDLESANGTYVNGAEVKKRPVRPGDKLEIGPIVFVVKYALSSAALEKLRRREQETAEAIAGDAVDDIPVVDVEAADDEVLDVEAADDQVLDDQVLDVEAVDREAVDDEVLDVEAVDVETEEVSGRKVTKKHKPAAAKPLKKTETAPPKKEEKPKKAKDEEDVPIELDGGASWQGSPGGGDIRDILSQLE
jgi:pSer/pThr/pTyr-binding forkhead associated (FHA) protein